MRFPGLYLAAAVTLAACNPYDYDEFNRAAHALAPACFGRMTGFWIPPEHCADALQAWGAGLEEFGPPPKAVRVTAAAEPWGGKAGTFECDASQAVIATNLGWCSSALIHELVHATRCLEPRESEKVHVGWGDHQRPAPGTIFYRIEQAKERCRQ